MAIQLEEIRARLTADTAHFRAGFQSAEQAVQTFNARVPQTTRLVSTLKQGITTLAFQAAGLPGPLGKMSSTLLSFAGGSALVIGVTAGLGIIATAINRAAEEAENLQKEAREASATLMDLMRSRQAALASAGPGQEGNLQARASTIRDAIRDLERQAAIQRGLVGLATNDAQRLIANQRVQETEDRIVALRRSLLEVTQTLTRIDTDRSKSVSGILLNEQQTASALARTVALLKEINKLELERDAIKAGVMGAKIGKAVADKPDFAAEARSLRQELEKAVLGEKAVTDYERMGDTIGRILADGILQGFQDSADLLRTIFAAVLNYALGGILGGIFSGLGGVGKAAAALKEGGTFGGGGVISPAMMNLNVNTGSLPAAMTPFDVARDSQWQRVLRESALVAHHDGFRFS